MTTEETIKIINKAIIESENVIAELSKIKALAERKSMVGEYYANIQNSEQEIEACKVAIEALKEIQQYRAIGTVDEIKAVYAENKRWHTNRINKKIKNPFANTSTLICQNCDHKDEYIQELEAEIEKYRSAARCYKNAIEIVEKGGIE